MKLYASEARQRLALVAAELQGADALEVGRRGRSTATWPSTSRRARGWSSTSSRFANTISAGSSEIQRNIIAERVLGLPRG